MSNRLTPEDADLIARSVVARLVRLVIGIGLTMFGLWLLPVIAINTVRAGGQSDPGGLTVMILGGVAMLALVFAGVTYWSRELRRDRAEPLR